MPDEILIGSAGSMFALQIPERSAYQESAVKFGAVHRGMTGAATLDNMGVRREWSIAWEDLDPADCSLLSALYYQLRQEVQSIRLIQPWRKNLLSQAASSAGSVAVPRALVTNYQTTSSTVIATKWQVAGPTGDAIYDLGAGIPRLTTYTQVINTTVTAQTVWPEGNPTGTTYTRVPVIPGRTYTLSGYVRRPVAGTGTTSLGLQLAREDGSTAGAPAPTTTAVTAAAWTWAAVTLTIPAGWHSVIPYFTLANSATLDVAAMQLEEGSARSAWEFGSGVPVVALTDLTFTDTEWPRRNASIRIIEL